MDAQMKKLVKTAKEQGWLIEKTENNHWMFVPPDGGRIIYTGSTPSDSRSRRNLIADLRRGGLKTDKRFS